MPKDFKSLCRLDAAASFRDVVLEIWRPFINIDTPSTVTFLCAFLFVLQLASNLLSDQPQTRCCCHIGACVPPRPEACACPRCHETYCDCAVCKSMLTRFVPCKHTDDAWCQVHT